MISPWWVEFMKKDGGGVVGGLGTGTQHKYSLHHNPLYFSPGRRRIFKSIPFLLILLGQTRWLVLAWSLSSPLSLGIGSDQESCKGGTREGSKGAQISMGKHNHPWPFSKLSYNYLAELGSPHKFQGACMWAKGRIWIKSSRVWHFLTAALPLFLFFLLDFLHQEQRGTSRHNHRHLLFDVCCPCRSSWLEISKPVVIAAACAFFIINI